MKRFVAAAVAAKMSYAGLFQFRGTSSSSIRVVFLRLFDGWRQGSVARSTIRPDVSCPNARVARVRTAVVSSKRTFDADRSRRGLGARGRTRQGDGPLRQCGIARERANRRARSVFRAPRACWSRFCWAAPWARIMCARARSRRRLGAKELEGQGLQGKKGWKPVAPSDLADRGAWWTIHREPELDRLVAQVEISNQTVAAAEANYLQASEIIREGAGRAVSDRHQQLFHCGNHRRREGPRLLVLPPAVRPLAAPPPALLSHLFHEHPAFNWNYTAALNAAWAVDVWGRIRRTVEADAASAQVSAADLANAKLLAQAQLVTAYFNLRASDELEGVIEDTLKEFRRTRDILKNQYAVGISSRADFITADNQVLSTEAQAINVGVARARYEHAIAVLTGRPPYELSIPRRRWATQTPPRFPVTVPSRLLERRPDIAAAERQLQQLNALVGVAVANFYPNISLTGALTFIGPQPWPVIAANEAWSIIGGATQTMYRRRPARRPVAGGQGQLRAGRRELSPNRAHGVPAGRGPTRGDSHPGAGSREI